MSGRDLNHEQARRAAPVNGNPTCAPDAPGTLQPSLVERPVACDPAMPGVAIAELLALDDALVPLVLHRGAAVRARCAVDLHATHIGAQLVLAFEGGDPALPVVMAVLRGAAAGAATDSPGVLEVEADGGRMLLRAKEQLVLRCGKASITLTRAGKVLISGSYVLSRSSGVNRVKGGSVQIN